MSAYEGGFDIANGGAHFTVRCAAHEEDVDFHLVQHGRGLGSASTYVRLTPDEARELGLALGFGASAAETTRDCLSDAAVSG